MQYAAECADSNLAVSWHNCGASASIGRSSELDMAPALADLDEACSLSLRATSRNGRGLSGTDFNLDGVNFRQQGGDGRFKMERERLTQIR